MVLLTQSQVGFLLSGIVIFMCTSALFLSGYVLQQKTVNDIRLVIKPQVAPLKPDIDLPPLFRDKDYWDGREGKPLLIQQGDHASPARDESMVGATRWQKAKKLKEQEEAAQAKREQAAKEERKKAKKTKGWFSKAKEAKEEEKPLSRAARRKKIKEEIIAAGEGEVPQGYRRKWI